jgi:hypothetical protein
MFVLRRFALLVLILAVLPWGAYAHAWAAPAPVLSIDAAMSADDGAVPTKFMGKPKRCRTALLLGAACGPDVSLVLSAWVIKPRLVLGEVEQARERLLVDRAPEGALDPPRWG